MGLNFWIGIANGLLIELFVVVVVLLIIGLTTA